jgi:hypothetical protein
LARGFDDAALVRRAAVIIDHHVLKRSRFIDDLMDVSRVRLGNLELDIQEPTKASVLSRHGACLSCLCGDAHK